MNEKRSLQDLTDLLAEKHDLSKKDAEAVVKGMFDLIEEALDRDKYVKVKGLGTFKLTEVESRESVDVNTGDRIEIQGHNKVSFTPDTSMKDLINKPFAHFETVILNEGIQLEDTVTETEEELAEELRNENDADAVVPGMESSVASIPADSPSADGASSETSSEISSQTSSGVSSEISSGTSSLSGVSSPTGLEASSSLTSSGASSSSEASSTVTSSSTPFVTSSSGPSPSSASAVDESPVSAAGGSAIRDQFGAVGKETEVASLTIVARKVEITSEQVTANCMSLDDGTPLKSASHDSDGPLSSESRDSSIPPVDATMADQLAQYRRWIWILAVLLLLSMVLGGYFFFLSRTGSASGTVGVETPATVLLKDARSAEGKSEGGKSEERNAEDGKGKKGNSERRNSEGGKPEKLNQDSLAVFGQETPTSVIPEQAPSTEPVSGQPHRSATLKDTLEYDITGTQAQHTLREGESLIKIALKYFGNKEMWPYIVRHNADVIRDANRVPVGTRLRIPQLTPRE